MAGLSGLLTHSLVPQVVNDFIGAFLSRHKSTSICRLPVARSKHEAVQQFKALVREQALQLLDHRIQLWWQRRGVPGLRGGNDHVHSRLYVLLSNIELFGDFFETGDRVFGTAADYMFVVRTRNHPRSAHHSPT